MGFTGTVPCKFHAVLDAPHMPISRLSPCSEQGTQALAVINRPEVAIARS